MFTYFVYILANRKNGVLYIGMTNHLLRRLHEHKEKSIEGFTKRYNVRRLVYFEMTHDVFGAIWREKQLKWWKRAWKVQLIEKSNPNWRDLYYDLTGETPDQVRRDNG